MRFEVTEYLLFQWVRHRSIVTLTGFESFRLQLSLETRNPKLGTSLGSAYKRNFLQRIQVPCPDAEHGDFDLLDDTENKFYHLVG